MYIVPLLIFALLSAHLAIIWRQKHTQFPGAEEDGTGHTERNVIGSPLWPTYAAKSIGMGAFVAGVCALLGGLAQINPVWQYGPYEPAAVSTAAQPDYYVGWLEGALRLAPPWYLHLGPYSVPEVFWPGVLLPGVVFGLLYAWPFLEARVTRDRRAHHLLDRPRDRPVRTAIGIGAITFFVVLLVAGGQDVVAQEVRAPITRVSTVLQILCVTLPFVTAAIAWKWCHDLAAADARRDPDRAAPPPRTEQERPHAARGACGPPPAPRRARPCSRVSRPPAGACADGVGAPEGAGGETTRLTHPEFRPRSRGAMCTIVCPSAPWPTLRSPRSRRTSPGHTRGSRRCGPRRSGSGPRTRTSAPGAPTRPGSSATSPGT